MPATPHVCIVGGGLVGISFALALRQATDPDRLRITLLEAFPLDRAPAEAPQALDARSTALSWGTRQIFQQLGLWEALAGVTCPIEAIHVSEQGRFGVTRLRAAESGVPALGYVVENAHLGRALLQALQRCPDIRVQAPVAVASLQPQADGYQVVARDGDGGAETLCADLVVICDGGKSDLYAQAGIHRQQLDYAQQAVVFNVRGAQPHRGIAYERFTGDGPIALLPLPGDVRAVICTLAPEAARRLLAAGVTAVPDLLGSQFGGRLGALLEVGEMVGHPLTLLRAGEQVRPGLVVLGNAAHTLHPVAGQGFNLAMRDAQVLAELLSRQSAAGGAPGDLQVLQQYQRRRATDQDGVIGFTHGLIRAFSGPLASLGPLRGGALLTLDLLGPARQLLADHAMGVA